MWKRIKTWFRSSETLLLARAQMFASAVLAALQMTDFSPLFYTGAPTREQWIMIGILFTQGLLTELSRRARTETVDGRLVAKEDL